MMERSGIWDGCGALQVSVCPVPETIVALRPYAIDLDRVDQEEFAVA